MKTTGTTCIWTLTSTALGAAPGWGVNPQLAESLKATVVQANGRIDAIGAEHARDILSVIQSPNAAQYFGPKKVQQGRINALRAMLEPQAKLAPKAPQSTETPHFHEPRAKGKAEESFAIDVLKDNGSLPPLMRR